MAMNNYKTYCLRKGETDIVIGECRLCYARIFAPGTNDDGTPGKYSAQLLIPKTNTRAVQLLQEAAEAAKQKGPKGGWGAKAKAAQRITLNLRDGDVEKEDDPVYEGMWFINASSQNRPDAMVRENGIVSEALDDSDIYSGCWAAVHLSLYGYDRSGNIGVTCGLQGVTKTRDDARLSGGIKSSTMFDELFGSESGSCLD